MRHNVNPNPVEPSAADRQLALLRAQLFVAHLEQGFTEEQALELVKFTVYVSMQDTEEYDD